VPFGQSYLPVEAPMTAQGRMACWLRAVAPAPLRGTKLIASLLQSGWDASAGCQAALTEKLALTPQGKDIRCVAPGRSHGQSTGAGTITVDATLAVGFADAGRAGVACLDGADAASGYYVAATADGVLELWK